MFTDKRVPRMNSQAISNASLYKFTLSASIFVYLIIYSNTIVLRHLQYIGGRAEYRIRTPKSATFQLVGARCIRQLHSNEQ
jgi:hypothetical protein